ncbi:hypothetical protein ON010_g15664 [Phytophthora cinnamomi]|nr:hypothetical protein ON010_g15664 [Phytophthora cinnamomi]
MYFQRSNGLVHERLQSGNAKSTYVCSAEVPASVRGVESRKSFGERSVGQLHSYEQQHLGVPTQYNGSTSSEHVIATNGEQQRHHWCQSTASGKHGENSVISDMYGMEMVFRYNRVMTVALGTTQMRRTDSAVACFAVRAGRKPDDLVEIGVTCAHARTATDDSRSPLWH